MTGCPNVKRKPVYTKFRTPPELRLAEAGFGWLAFNSVAHDAPSHAAMIEHRTWALATLASYFPFVVWSVTRHRTGRKPHVLFLSALIALTALLGSTAWYGAELVYRHGLGVLSLPVTEKHSAVPHEHGTPNHHAESESKTHTHN